MTLRVPVLHWIVKKLGTTGILLKRKCYWLLTQKWIMSASFEYWLCEPRIWVVKCVGVSEETMKITTELLKLQAYKTIILNCLQQCNQVISVTYLHSVHDAEGIPSCDFVRHSLVLYLAIDHTTPTAAQEMYMYTSFTAWYKG